VLLGLREATPDGAEARQARERRGLDGGHPERDGGAQHAGPERKPLDDAPRVARMWLTARKRSQGTAARLVVIVRIGLTWHTERPPRTNAPSE
jgi:hypothetical protein